MAGKTSDQIYDNLYVGDVITINDVSELVAPNIPMDPLAYDFNQVAKKKYISFHPKFQWWSYQFVKWMFILGLGISFVMFLSSPNWTNGLVTIIYLLFLLKRLLVRHPRIWGRLMNHIHEPLALREMILRPVGVPDFVSGKTVTTAVDGKFFIKSAPGKYNLQVLTNGQIIHTEVVEISKEGTLNKNIIV